MPPSEGTVRTLDQAETDALEHALNYYSGNRRHAAKALGISERSLYRKLKEKGLDNYALPGEPLDVSDEMTDEERMKAEG